MKRVAQVGLAAVLVAVPVGVATQCDEGTTCDMSSDHTIEVQQKLDAGLDVTGCLRVEGTLHLRRSGTTLADVTFVRTVRSYNRNASMLQVEADGITLSHVTVRGEKPDTQGYDPTQEGQHGIVVSGASGVTLDSVTVDQVRGDGIYMSGANDVVLENSRISETGRHGIGIVSGSSIQVLNNYTEATHRWSMDLESNSSSLYVDQVTIMGNTFYGPTMGFISGVGPHNNGTSCDADPNNLDCNNNITNVVAEPNTLDWGV